MTSTANEPTLSKSKFLFSPNQDTSVTQVPAEPVYRVDTPPGRPAETSQKPNFLRFARVTFGWPHETTAKYPNATVTAQYPPSPARDELGEPGMRLRTRLQKLEQSRTFVGCPACRHRRVIVTRTCTPLPDGSVVWDVDKPQPCARCGQIPEQIIEVILSVVDERSNVSE
jgi:hypothetical protein